MFIDRSLFFEIDVTNRVLEFKKNNLHLEKLYI